MDGAAIVAALETLRVRYPGEQVAIWARYEANGKPSFVASIGADYSHTALDPVIEIGDTLELALSKCLTKAGERSPEKLRANRIAKLRDELAKLEAAP